MSLTRYKIVLASDKSKGTYEIIEETVHDNGQIARGPVVAYADKLIEAIAKKDEFDQKNPS